MCSQSGSKRQSFHRKPFDSWITKKDFWLDSLLGNSVTSHSSGSTFPPRFQILSPESYLLLQDEILAQHKPRILADSLLLRHGLPEFLHRSLHGREINDGERIDGPRERFRHQSFLIHPHLEDLGVRDNDVRRPR